VISSTKSLKGLAIKQVSGLLQLIRVEGTKSFALVDLEPGGGCRQNPEDPQFDSGRGDSCYLQIAYFSQNLTCATQLILSQFDSLQFLVYLKLKLSTAQSAVAWAGGFFIKRKIFNTKNSWKDMAETLTINKSAIVDLIRLKEDFDSIVESIELMSNKEFMDSYKRAKEQIRKREFCDWDAL